MRRVLIKLRGFCNWFDLRFGWFFTNGRKEEFKKVNELIKK